MVGGWWLVVGGWWLVVGFFSGLNVWKWGLIGENHSYFHKIKDHITMPLKQLLIILIAIVFSSCGSTSEKKSNGGEATQTEEVKLSGTIARHCALVQYQNPSSGRESEYHLVVEVQENHLIKLEFIDGHLDADHFTPPSIDANGKCSFVNDKGYNYEVQLLGPEGDCGKYMSEEKQCSGRTKSGDRCKRMTTDPSGKCWQH